MLCQPFLIKVLQSFIKVGPFSNYYIKAINKGKNDINPSLESRETFITMLYTVQLIFSADISNYRRVSSNTFMTAS